MRLLDIDCKYTDWLASVDAAIRAPRTCSSASCSMLVHCRDDTLIRYIESCT